MFRVCRHATCRVCSARVVYKIEKAVCRSSVYKCAAWTVRMPRPLNPGHHRLNAAASGDVGLNWSCSSYKCAPAPPPPLSEKLGQGNKKSLRRIKKQEAFSFFAVSLILWDKVGFGGVASEQKIKFCLKWCWNGASPFGQVIICWFVTRTLYTKAKTKE